MCGGTSRRGESVPGTKVDMLKSLGRGKAVGMSDEWWFCLKHQRVEQGSGCANSDRMGPYASSQEAASALARAAERNERWDKDPKWNDED